MLSPSSWGRVGSQRARPSSGYRSEMTRRTSRTRAARSGRLDGHLARTGTADELVHPGQDLDADRHRRGRRLDGRTTLAHAVPLPGIAPHGRHHPLEADGPERLVGRPLARS